MLQASAAGSYHDSRIDRVAQGASGHSQHGHLANLWQSDDEDLYFRRADAVTARLDHFVAPPDEVEESFGVTRDDVARPDRVFRSQATTQAAGERTKTLGRPRRRIPVAQRNQRPAMHQFARFSDGAYFSLGIQHEDFSARDGL